MIKPPWRCPHCHTRSTSVSCVTCNREMCEECVSIGDVGKVCGLCKDRETALKRYERKCLEGKPMPTFDDWYDENA